MKNDLVSVIVPIYNAEKYLDKALDSIRQQTYHEIEAILIDDGSSDNSNLICQKYAEADSRFKVYRVENGGVSRARNYGLDRAKGKFVLFLDSDDWFESNAIENLIKDSDRLSCDFLIASYNDIIKDEVIVKYICDKDCESEAVINSKIWENFLSKATTPWAKLYNLNIIKDNQIYFDKSIKYGEDFIFNIKYISYVKKVGLSRSVVYNYRIMAEGSAQTKYFKDMAKYRIAVADAYLKYIDPFGEDKLFEMLLGSGIGHYCTYITDENAFSGINELILFFKNKISFRALRNQFGYCKAVLIKLGYAKVFFYIVQLKKRMKSKG